ncbi:P-loop containing nucleoside triphosphate hydrolase protein [Aspergillus ambiguus]|uniref:P-loop containing nucleoside triphosphate hydrolase protein n=1 Tax=Aspergillus ambiguus TaxID=176160 RepID=UPI003CCCF0EA
MEKNIVGVLYDDDNVQAPPSPKTYWCVPLMRNPRFVGRDQQLQELETMLFKDDYFQKAAIFGLGGAGKTQIALELAFRTRSCRPDCSAFWVVASSAEAMLQSFLSIASRLKLPGSDDPDADIVSLVQRFLSDEYTGRWLLVLDGMDEIDFGQRRRKPESTVGMHSLPQCANGSILMTTRNRKIAVDFARKNVLDVPHDDEATGLEILRGSLSTQAMAGYDESTVMQLLQRLTFLPLAVVQAATYMDKNDISPTEYLTLWDNAEDTTIELLSEDFDDDWRYREIKNPVAATWLISFEQIRSTDPLAADYLSFIPCLDPAMVPQSLLPAPSKKRMLDAIGTLVAYSFVTKRPEGGFLDVHRLVHLAMRDWNGNQGTLLYWTQEVMNQLIEKFVFEIPDRPTWRAHLHHFQFVLATNPADSTAMQRCLLMKRYGSYLLVDGRPAEAEQLLRGALDIGKQVFGDEDVVPYAVQTITAQAIWAQGRYEEATAMNISSLKAQGKALGKEHSITLATMDSKGGVLSGKGNLPKAEMLYRHILDIQSKIIGPNDLRQLVTMNNLAMTFQYQGKLEEAEALLRKGVELEKIVFGLDRVHVFTLAHNLGDNLASQKKYEEAIRLHHETLEASRLELGEDHLCVLQIISNLATVFCWQGEFEMAEKYYNEFQEKGRETLGDNHSLLILSLSNLANLRRLQGRLKEAEDIHRAAISKAKSALGDEHKDTLICITNFANMLLEQNRYMEARDMLQAAFNALTFSQRAKP